MHRRRRKGRPRFARPQDGFFPLHLLPFEFGRRRAQAPCEVANLGFQFFLFGLLRGRGKIEPRLDNPRVALVLRAVEEGQKLIILLLGEGIVFVIVALRATQCGAEPNRGRGIGTVDERFPIGLFLIDAAFLVEHRIPVETSGYLLIHAGVRQKVARDLFDREPIVRHVAIERLNDPVPIFPDGAAAVRFIAIRVGVTRQVEPRPRPSLSIVRRCEETVYQPFIRVGAAIR